MTLARRSQVHRGAWRVLAVLGVLLGAARSGRAEPIDAAAQDAITRFARAIKCGRADRDLQRAWCAVTRLRKGAPILPKEPVTYFGLTVALKPGDDVRKALLAKLAPSALHLSSDGARLTSIRPSAGPAGEGEKRELLEAGMSASMVLKGERAAVAVPRGLAEYLDAQRAKPMNPLTVRGAGADFTGQIPGRLYAADGAWVVIEQASDGVYVNLFPIAPIERR